MDPCACITTIPLPRAKRTLEIDQMAWNAFALEIALLDRNDNDSSSSPPDELRLSVIESSFRQVAFIRN